MNRFYRTVFNARLGQYQVASELACSRGSQPAITSRVGLGCGLALAIACGVGSPLVGAAPMHGQDGSLNIVSGGASGSGDSVNGRVLFWDGARLVGNGAIQGGNGTWDTMSTNWTTVDGTGNRDWSSDFAVFQAAAGDVLVNGTQSITGMQFVTDGYRLLNGVAGELALVNGTNGSTTVRVDPGVTATVNVALTGNGLLSKVDSGTLVLGGINSYSGGTALSGGTLSVGNNAALGSGALTATGTSTLKNTQSLALMNAIAVNGDLTLDTANNLTLGGLISGTGNLIKAGAQELVVFGNNTFSGKLDITQGMVTTLNANALGNLASVNLGSGTDLNLNGNTNIGALTGSGTTNIALGSTLSLGSTNLNSVFAGAFVGDGRLNKVGSGVLELSGISALSGASQVSAGTLNVTGTLNGAGLTVNSGATLTGSGSVGGVVNVMNGGHLAGTSGTQLNFGSLTLAPNANVDVALGSPFTGGTALFKVGGTLTLDGTLNITDDGGLGNGVYRLFDYSALVNNGLILGSLPGSVTPGELQLQTAIGGQVNLLINSSNLIVQFWDGQGTVADGTVQGGSGIWNNSSTNWTDLNGTNNDSWFDQFAIFQGAAGVVTVEGSQTANALQFVTDGYQLVAGAGGALNAVNGSSGSFAVRVDPNVTATLDLPIDGSATLAKLDTGTLVLNGANGYTGGTLLNGGTLVVGNNSALGSGTMTTANGTTLDSNQAVRLGNAIGLLGQLRIGGSNALTLDGDISGNGGLLKAGTATLTLNGNNSYAGPTVLNAGTLVLGSNTALGAGALNAAAGTQLDSSSDLTLTNTVNLAGNLVLLGSNDLTLSGLVNGAGGLTKQGSGNLTLNGVNGVNGFTGGTVLQNGTLTVGNGGALGTGALTVTGASSLVNSSALSLANAIVLNAGLSLPGSNDLTLGGVISGSGGLNHSGTGGLTLTGVNTYSGGTQLAAGNLTLGNGAALGSGALSVSGTSTLTNSSAMTLANTVDVSGTLSVASSNNLTLAGVLSGAGTLNKNGLADLTLSGNNTFTGILNILSGSLSTVGSGALGNPAQLNLSSGASLNLGGSTSLDTLSGAGSVKVAAGTGLQVGEGTFGGVLSGTGTLDKVGGGTLTLGGSNTLSGATNVNAGSLIVNGSLASSSVTVNNGATLGGTGSLGGALTVADGGHLSVRSGSTLSVGSLVLGPDANLDAALGAPVVGSAGLINVGGNLTLDGKLNVSDIGGFGTGVYRLIDYTGTLTNNGLDIGSVPSGVAFGDLDVQTAINNQVNLVVGGASNTVLFWDGSQTTGNGSIGGGSGVWSVGGTNWTNANGTLNLAWNDTFAVFQGAGGAVTLAGVQTVTGLQFLDNGYTLGGDALALVDGASGTSNVRIGNGITATLDVDVTGSGTLAKLEGGTLVLNGNNTYTGGTQLNDGTLVAGSNTALGLGTLSVQGGTTLDSNTAVNLANAVVLNGSLTLAGSHNLTLSGVVSGNGELNKQGASELTLSGNNTFSGVLNVLNGKLNLIGNTALGNAHLNVANNASASVFGVNNLDALTGSGALLLAAGSTLQLGASGASSVYDGSINGAGHLTKIGSGKQVLNGNSTVDGGTTVAAGSLIIGGAAGSNANLASNVDVAMGAILGGHGTINGDINLASGATLSPGNSIGTLNVTGDINFNSGSTLVIEADPDGRSDRVIATGTVSLSGSGLNIVAGAGNWAPSTQYRIIEASNLTGTFANVSSNLIFLTPQVTYASNGVTLDLQRNNVSFTSVAQTYNQRAVAGTLDSAGAGGLYNVVAALNADQARSAYDSLSGEIHASTRGALLDESRYVRDAIGTRLQNVQGQAPSEGVLHVDADSSMTFWLQGYGSWGDRDGNSNVAALDHNSQGMLLGVDMPLNDTWHAGLAAGYGNSDLDADGRNSSAKVDSTSLTAYLGGQWDALHLRMGVSHAWNDVDSSRHVNVGSVQEHVKAKYDASTTQVFGELGYAIQAGDFTLEPFVGLAHVEVDSDSFREHGGSTALSGDSEKSRATYSSLGVRVSTPEAEVVGVPLSVHSSLAWQRVLDKPSEESHLALAGYDSFAVKGVPIAQDTALIQLGVSAKLAPQTSLDLGYSGQIGDGYRDHGIRLGLNIAF